MARNIRGSKEFVDAQGDQSFRSWLTTQHAAMEHQFIVADVPELQGHQYTREGVIVAERAALGHFAGQRQAFDDENLPLAMRFVYFLGEAVRRHTEGTWVVLPKQGVGQVAVQAVDLPFRMGFFKPINLLQMALALRTGQELVRVFDYEVEGHRIWVDSGRQPRPRPTDETE